MTQQAQSAPLDSEFVVRPMRADAQDLERFATCFAKNGSPRARELLEWQYLKNPTGRLFVDFALAGDQRLAAIYATLPLRLHLRNESVLGTQSVDTITDADFRGRGLFLHLAQRTYARAASEQAKLVYGFPNGNSAHGFFKRLDWTSLDPVPFLIRPLRVKYVVEQLKLPRLAERLPNPRLIRRSSKPPPRGRVERIETFDERATALWRELGGSVDVAVLRDAAYLNWRLVEKPRESYITTGIFDGERLLAWVAHTVKSKHGGRVGYVMESLCVPGHESSLRYLLSSALAEMADHDADVALAWCFPHSATFGSLLRSGFVPFPQRLRPIELHVGARSFTEDAACARSRAGWYMSYLDSDTV